MTSKGRQTQQPLMVGHTLHSHSTQYTILEFTGEGCFGKVAKCYAHNTSKLVAVKILKKEYCQDVEGELSMLRCISCLNADQFNLVTFFEQFQYLGHNCLVFELLDVNLFHLVCSMNVNHIRPIAKQLMMALHGLDVVGVIHRDIKPDNVMIVNIDQSPVRVKLIDFGMASFISAVMPGIIRQPIGYRAPEVCLGLPYSGAIDLWGVGCLLAFLFLNDNLFPVHCEYLMMKSMVELLGMPSKQQLKFGLYSKTFFCHDDKLGWRLLTPKEYTARTGSQAEEWPEYRPHWSSLDDLLYTSVLGENETIEDRRIFIEFLKELLQMNGDERISPIEALQHPFITGSYLSQEPDNIELQTKAQVIMTHETQDRDAGYSLSSSKAQSGHFEPQSPEDWDTEYPLSPEKAQYGHVEPQSPEDWDTEYPLSSEKAQSGHFEPQSPEDWDTEYPFSSEKAQYGHVEPQSPEDWDTEYPFSSEKAQYGHVEPQSPEDWDTEYPLSSEKAQSGHFEPQSPEDWDTEYPFSSEKAQYGHVEPQSPEDWDTEYPFSSEKAQYGHVEPQSPEDWDTEYPLSSEKAQSGHVEPQSPEDWDTEYQTGGSSEKAQSGHVEPQSPEDWDTEYPLSSEKAKYGHVEQHSLEDWDAEYPLMAHSPGDWNAKYPLFSSKSKYGHVEQHSPEDWVPKYPYLLENPNMEKSAMQMIPSSSSR